MFGYERWGLGGLAIIALAAAGLAGCGDSDPGQEGSDRPVPWLLDRLPEAGGPGLATVDLERARRQLGAKRVRRGYLEVAAIRVATYLTLPEETALDEAIDLKQASAAVGSGHDSGWLVLIATHQPFEEIAGRLRRRGWKQRGETLTAPPGPGVPSNVRPTEIAAGDGFVAIGFERKLVTDAATGEAGPTEGVTRDLVEELETPLAYATVMSEACVTAGAIGSDCDRRSSGTMILVIDDPDLDRVRYDKQEARWGGYELVGRAVDGDRLRLDFRPHPPDALGTAFYYCP